MTNWSELLTKTKISPEIFGALEYRVAVLPRGAK